MPDIVPEQSPTAEAVQLGALDLPEPAQQFFATVAAAEERRLAAKNQAKQDFKDATPYEKLLVILLQIGKPGANTVLLQNQAAALMRDVLITQADILPVLFNMAEEEGAAVSVAETDLDEL